VIVAACACAAMAASAAPAHAAIAFRGASTLTTLASSTQSSLNIAAPSGLAAGDVMVATIVSRSPSNAITAAGWTSVANANTAAGVVVRMATFEKVATSTDVSTGSFTFDLGGATKAAGGILAYSGVDTATPIDNAATTASAAAGTTATAPAITTTNLNARVLVITGWAIQAAVSPDNATTERYEDSSTVVPASNDATVEAADLVQATPGSVGPYTITGGSARWIAQTIALNEMPQLTASFPSNYAWPALVPGTTATSSEQTVSVTSNRAWGVQLSSDRADGLSRQWNGSSYGSLALAGPLQWRTSSINGAAQGTTFANLSGSAATAVTGHAASASAVSVGITFRQPVSYADEAALPAGNTYRQNVSYTAQQGF